jgi:hypothetical protein
VHRNSTFDLSLEELRVLDPSLPLVLPGKLQHLIGHVHAIGLAPR